MEEREIMNNKCDKCKILLSDKQKKYCNECFEIVWNEEVEKLKSEERK